MRGCFAFFPGPDIVQDTPITNATEVEEERNMKRKSTLGKLIWIDL
jgi:hypothetical protein